METKTLDYYSDSGHGWIKCPIVLLKELGISNHITEYSYKRKDFAYLEEDCDARTLQDACERNEIELKFREHCCNGRSRIRNYNQYL